jgi:transcriptional regulator with XRE-family HTH domain
MEIMVRGEGIAASNSKANKKRKAGAASREYKQIITSMRAFRQLRGLTLSQMGEKLKLSIGQLSRMERGLCEPGILQALRVADVLDVSVRELWPSQVIKRVHQVDAVELVESTLAGGKK